MVTRWLGNGVMDVLAVALEGASLRHRVLANNIANANTPGFKRSDVTFAGCLQEVLQGQPGRPSSVENSAGPEMSSGRWAPQVVTQHHTVGRNDGNNVEMELEMTLLSSNAIWYQALTRQYSDQIGRLRSVIHEGRR